MLDFLPSKVPIGQRKIVCDELCRTLHQEELRNQLATLRKDIRYINLLCYTKGIKNITNLAQLFARN